mgnify:CR=1 FL=1|tara:strand:- start:18258 stop:18530 length:273 start_codon:yes stop_codon:yes gene_type:complete
MENDEEFWEEHEDLDTDSLAQLRFEEVEFRIRKATEMLSSVCDNVQIGVSWVDPDNGETQLYHYGEGNTIARVGTAQHFINQYNTHEGWD